MFGRGCFGHFLIFLKDRRFFRPASKLSPRTANRPSSNDSGKHRTKNRNPSANSYRPSRFAPRVTHRSVLGPEPYLAYAITNAVAALIIACRARSASRHRCRSWPSRARFLLPRINLGMTDGADSEASAASAGHCQPRQRSCGAIRMSFNLVVMDGRANHKVRSPWGRAGHDVIHFPRVGGIGGNRSGERPGRRTFHDAGVACGRGQQNGTFPTCRAVPTKEDGRGRR